MNVHVSTAARGFFESREPEPHVARTRALLAAHPEARALIGPNPWTIAIAVFVVALQTGIAAALGVWGAWWAALVAAWCIGAFANHCLYVVIHEATHDLIFRRRAWNRFAAVFADMPNLVPAAMGFRVYHLKHHSSQGEYGNDLDLPSEWETRVFGSSTPGKIAWLALFPLLQALRAPRSNAYSLFAPWSLLNLAACLLYGVTMWWAFGGLAVLYLFASFWFSIGLHPLGARWIQEHFTRDPRQETGSYYGPLNIVALNVGYHNEHHDLPSVPWNRLPRLKALAPELYEPLVCYRSWAGLLIEFIVDPRFAIASRVTRPARKAPSRAA